MNEANNFNGVMNLLEKDPLSSINLLTSDNPNENEVAVSFLSSKYPDIKIWLERIIDAKYSTEEYKEEKEKVSKDVLYQLQKIEERYKWIEDSIIREKPELNIYWWDKYDKEIYDEYVKNKNAFIWSSNGKYRSPEVIKNLLGESYQNAVARISMKRIEEEKTRNIWPVVNKIPEINTNWVNIRQPWQWTWSISYSQVPKNVNTNIRNQSFEEYMLSIWKWDEYYNWSYREKKVKVMSKY